MDQNEKIAQGFDCTHVALNDGYSRMMCKYSSMEVKNPILIYEFVFHPAIIQYGLWNLLRIDHDQEFVLCTFVQDLLKTYGENTEKDLWMQTTSTQSNVIDLLWPELNSRVNHPIKRTMIDISGQCEYDMSDPVLKYCVSWVINFVCKDAAEYLINSWNFHRIPGPLACVPAENMLHWVQY